jgi:hypothetical protein
MVTGADAAVYPADRASRRDARSGVAQNATLNFTRPERSDRSLKYCTVEQTYAAVGRPSPYRR